MNPQDELDELRRKVEELESHRQEAKPNRRARLNPFRIARARREADRAFYERQKAARPTDNAGAIGGVLAVVVIAALVWAASSWWMGANQPASTGTASSKPPPAAAASAPATSAALPSPPYIDGAGPQAVPGNTVPAQSARTLPTPAPLPFDPANAESVIANMATAWFNRTGPDPSTDTAWKTSVAPLCGTGLVDSLAGMPMVRTALTQAGDTVATGVQLAPVPGTPDTPTRTTRAAVVTVANTSGAPLLLKLGFTAYKDGDGWKVAMVEETSYTRATS